MSRAPTLPVQERAANALRSVLAVAARVLRGLSTLAAIAAISVTAAWVVALAEAPPEDANEWVSRLVVLAIALIVLGPKKLPEVGRSVGNGLREFKDSLGGGSNKHDDEDDDRYAIRS